MSMFIYSFIIVYGCLLLHFFNTCSLIILYMHIEGYSVIVCDVLVAIALDDRIVSGIVSS